MSHKQGLDPRAKRSREWLSNALLELIKEKDYQKISITDITDRAGLSRPTFYLHYKSKNELLMDHIDSIFHPIMELYYRMKDASDIEQPGVFTMTKIFVAIGENAEIFRTALQAGADNLLILRLHEYNQEYLYNLARHCEMVIHPKVIQLTSRYMAGAFVTTFRNWLEDPHRATPEQMGAYLSRITIGLLRVAICNGELNDIFD